MFNVELLNGRTKPKTYQFRFTSGDDSVVCRISPLNECQMPIISESIYGSADKSDKDEWDRARGLKLALTRAMEKAEFSEKQREQVWLVYVKRYVTNQPKANYNGYQVARCI